VLNSLLLNLHQESIAIARDSVAYHPLWDVKSSSTPSDHSNGISGVSESETDDFWSCTMQIQQIGISLRLRDSRDSVGWSEGVEEDFTSHSGDTPHVY